MKKFSEVSNDLDKKELEIEVEKIDGSIEIESIVDIFVESDGDYTNENLIALNTDLSNKEIKRGDIVYITAFIKKPGHSMTSPATQSVLKLRVVDIYQGLAQLNRLIK
jgi:hypothetical protein